MVLNPYVTQALAEARQRDLIADARLRGRVVRARPAARRAQLPVTRRLPLFAHLAQLARAR